MDELTHFVGENQMEMPADYNELMNHFDDIPNDEHGHNNIPPQGEDYVRSYTYVCKHCTRRYSSITGLNYHLISFDHSNPPADYDPHKISKRGRPRGYRPVHKYRTTRHVPEVSELYDDNYTSRSGRRVFRPGVSHLCAHNDEMSRKLTYAEAQKLVEFEHNNKLFRVGIEEIIGIVTEQGSSTPHHTPSHNRNGASKRYESGPQPVWTVDDEYYLKHFAKNLILHSDSYFKTVEFDDSERVDYEMDEEDVAWLQIINSKGTYSLESATFEFIMDQLEKLSEFIVKTTDGVNPTGIEDDVVCAVCMDGDCNNTNLIVFCDICNMAFHQECYGLPYVPEGQWLCRRCSHAPSKELECVLCPSRCGSFKQTSDGRWCHIICALLMPGAKFANKVFLEPIDLTDISPTRFNVSCKLCHKTRGAVIQCLHANCCVSYHVSCGQAHGWIYLEKSEMTNAFDGQVPQLSSKYLSYCSKHLPSTRNSLNTPNVSSKCFNKNEASPTIHVPVISDDHVSQIASKLSIENSTLITLLIKRYWQIKRYLRSGVPLLRRRNYVNRNPTSAFKLSEKHFNNIRLDENTIYKMQQLKSYIRGLIELLEKVQERETLKHSRSLQERKVYQSTEGISDFLNKLLSFVEDRLKTSNIDIQLDKDHIFKTFYSLFDTKTMSKVKNFTNALYNTFNEYFSTSSRQDDFNKVASYISLFIYRSKPKRKSMKSTDTSTLDITPGNIDITLLVDELIQDISPDVSDEGSDDSSAYQIGTPVWAQLKKVKYYPAKIVEKTRSSKNDVFVAHVEFFSQDFSTKTFPIDLVYRLGKDPSSDREKLLHVLKSKSYDRNIKRQVLEAYKNALGYCKQRAGKKTKVSNRKKR